MESKLFDILQLERGQIWPAFLTNFPELAANEIAVSALINTIRNDFSPGCHHEDEKDKFQSLPLHFQVFYLFAVMGVISVDSLKTYLTMVDNLTLIDAYDAISGKDFFHSWRDLSGVILNTIDSSKIDIEIAKKYGNSIIPIILHGSNYDLFQEIVDCANPGFCYDYIKYATKTRFLEIIYTKLRTVRDDAGIYNTFMNQAIIVKLSYLVTLVAKFISEKSNTSLEKLLEMYYSIYGNSYIFYTGFVNAGLTVNFLRHVYSQTNNPFLFKWINDNSTEDV